MKEYAAGIQSSELRLVDVASEKPRETDAPVGPALSSSSADNGTLAPRNGSAHAGAATAPYNHSAPSPGEPENAKIASESGQGVVDKFFAAATKELEAGIIDQPLWKHAAAQSSGDRTLTTQHYLRARATALRVEKREKRQERSARRARALNELAQPADRAAAPAIDARASPAPAARRAASPRRTQVIWIGSTLALLFAVALLVVVRSQSDASRRDEPVAKTSSLAAAPGAKGARGANATAAGEPAGNRDDNVTEDWAGKLEKLNTEGNWNVVVLYAGEWARKQPDNPLAWKALVAGYVKLRQYRDALDAANKLVQLAPEDAGAWQSLGQVNVSLRRPAEALAAFEQAAARDDRDARTNVQIGALAAQLGRYPDARAAFAKALDVDPANVDALCGAASLAQKEQRAKDAEALLRQVAAQNARCRDPAEGESVRVAVGDKAQPRSPR